MVCLEKEKCSQEASHKRRMLLLILSVLRLEQRTRMRFNTITELLRHLIANVIEQRGPGQTQENPLGVCFRSNSHNVGKFPSKTTYFPPNLGPAAFRAWDSSFSRSKTSASNLHYVAKREGQGQG